MTPDHQALSTGAQGDAVAQLHALLQALGHTISADEAQSATFGDSTRAAVAAFQNANQLPPSGSADEQTAQALRREAASRRAGSSPATANDEIAVRGMVQLADQSPAARAAIQLVAQGVRGMRPLTRTTTDEHGAFAVRIDRQQLRGKGRLDDGLVAQVLDAQGQVLAQSDPAFRIGQSLTIRMILSAQVASPPTEFERVRAAAGSALDEGMTFASVTKPQILFIARQTGYKVHQVDALTRAEQNAAQSNIPATILYACGRQGLSAQVARLAPLSAQAIRTAVNKAASAGQIPPVSQNELDDAITRLRQARIDQVLNARPDEHFASLGDLLTLAQIPPATRQLIGTHAADSGVGTASFWQALHDDPGITGAQVAEIQFATQAADATGGYQPLLQSIAHARQTGRIRNASDLAQIDVPSWERLLLTDTNGRTIGAPAGTPGKTPAEQAHNYAQSVADALEKAFPTSAFVGHLHRNGLPGRPQARDNIVRFLVQNPGFDLRTDPAARYIATNQSALAGIGDQAAFQQDLAAVQRVFRISPKYEHVNALLQAGLDSAQHVARLGRSVFLDRHGQNLGQDGAVIYDRATHIVATANHVMTQQALSTFEDSIPALQDSAVSVEALKLQEELFGSLTFCACEECRSVLSPASYLADLLAWLSGRASTLASASALDVLLDRGVITAPPRVRRPDLAAIELSCINTNTPLPYIDLVNEILEQAIAGPVPLPLPLTSPQTTRSADELSVTPEHVNGAAYAAVADAVFPLNLPYDLPSSQADVFLQGMKSSREDLLVATYPGNSAAAYADPTTVRSVLGITPLAWKILTTPNPVTITPTPVQPWTLWGIAGATLLDPGGSGAVVDWFVALRYVLIFLQQSGITYTDLLALLRTRFMQSSHLSLNPPSPCELETATIHNLDGTAATRAHRFLRLRRVFGGTIDELDELLAALGITEITADVLTTLATIKRLQKLLPKLTLTQLATFWSSVSTTVPVDGGLSPYDLLFQNPSVTSPVNPAFALNAARTQLVSTSGAISGANAPAVLAALNIAPGDLVAMLQPAGPVPDAMSLENLSALARIVTLANALRLSVADFLAMRALISVSPFDSASIANTITWVQTVQQVQAAPLSVQQVVWLTEGGVPDTISAQLSDDAIIAQLTTLAGNLQAAAPGTDTSQMVKSAVWTMLNFPPTYPLTLISQLALPVGGSYPTTMLTHLQRLATGAVTPAQAVPSIRRLQQIGLLIATTGVTMSDLPYLFNLNIAVTPPVPAKPGLGWLDPNDLPASNAVIAPAPGRLTALTRLLASTRLCAGVHCSLRQLFSLFTFSGSKADALVLISGFTPWPLEDLQALAGTSTDGPLALPYAAAYESETAMLRFKACFDITRALNVSAARMLTWAVEPVTMAIAQDIRTAARAGFATGSAWVAAARPWQDTLREQQRDALVSYLCGQRQSADLTKQVNASTLYDEYLIDVSMNAVMMTSRIKQAISSTQLFIQRAFMNMEPLVIFADDDHQQWLWMRNYRVWEANRKVFLYPENWVLPELRDGKSKIFRELETALLQSQLTNDSAEAALSDYLASLYQISRLEIAGYFHQLETGSGGHQINTIHVIGATQSTPPTHYYRQYVDGAYWTAWDKIPHVIKSNHVVPVVYNRTLRLCWVTVKLVKDASIGASQVNNSGYPPPMQWQFTLNWSDYHQGKWTSPAKADNPDQQLLVDQYSPLDYQLSRVNTVENESDFFFKGFIDPESGDLVIRCYNYGQEAIPDGGGRVYRYLVRGDFRFAACQGTVSLVLPSSAAAVQYYPPVGSSDVNQTFAVQGNLTSDNPMVPILGHLPAQNASVAYGHQFLTDPLPAPFFFRDDQRSFFAMPQYAGFSISGDWRHRWRPGGSTSPQPQPQPAPDSSSPYVDGAYPADVIAALTHDAQQAQLRTVHTPDYRHWGNYQYLFDMAYHPWVCTFVEELARGGIDALYRRWVQVAPYILNSGDNHLTFFHDDYQPASAVAPPYPVADVDFRFGGSYSLYNWELFYHVPMLIAKRLADNQHFEDALKWVERIFDPNDRTLLAAPHRFWRMREFFEAGASPSIRGLLSLLDTNSPADSAARADINNQITQWRKSPFNPHLIARLRPSAYQKTAIMQYLDVLIGWGDQLFRQDTIETINEAAQMYVAAASILGPRPQRIPEAQHSDDKTFLQIQPALDTFSNALISLENYIPSGDTPSVSIYGGTPPPPTPILYFCIPPNAKLLAYWDTIADRLFKIRNSENIAGAAQQLPLFEPPIDPALLVAATAAGLSIADVLNAISSPPPLIYRFEVMIRRAHEMTDSVSALGAKLLAALEQKDARNLELLKSSQTLDLMQHVADVYQSRVDEAQQKIDVLTLSKQSQLDSAAYYDTLSAIVTMYDIVMDGLKVEMVILKGLEAGAHTTGAVAHTLPNASAGTVAVAPTANVEDGGTHAGHAADQAGDTADSGADLLEKLTGLMKDVRDDVLQILAWGQQAGDARDMADQLDKQIIAAQTAMAIAQKELDNFNRQMDQAQAVDDYYHSEFTSADLYGWMVGQIAAIYFQGYQVAYGVAQQAELTFRQELGLYPLSASNYITFGYWDSLNRGLLAGERLELDLNRMEAAYYQQHAREYEITRRVSLRQHAPAALATLLSGGSCYVGFGEDLFDADYPWHYMRRLKVVSMGVTFSSSVATPPPTINCTLSLVQDKIRTTAGRVGDPDQITTQVKSMVASGAQLSSIPSHAATYAGMFTIDFLNDERFFPFEGSGAISQWRIMMPMSTSFAGTVDDIWLELKYTARGEPPSSSDPLVTATP